MQHQLDTILQTGRRVLLVELYGKDLYVFGPDHEVAGPVRRVLESVGFEAVLPPGVEVAGTQNTMQPIEVLERAETDHVFFMNFSPDEDFVRDIQSQLADISGGRLYRIDSTVGEAFSDRWNETELAPKVTQAIIGDAS